MIVDGINVIIRTLSNFPAGEEVAAIEIDLNIAMMIAILAEIGCAPGTNIIGDEIRFLTNNSHMHGLKTVKLQMNRETAHNLAVWIHIGLHRHETGINYPDDVVLH